MIGELHARVLRHSRLFCDAVRRLERRHAEIKALSRRHGAAGVLSCRLEQRQDTGGLRQQHPSHEGRSLHRQAIVARVIHSLARFEVVSGAVPEARRDSLAQRRPQNGVALLLVLATFPYTDGGGLAVVL